MLVDYDYNFFFLKEANFSGGNVLPGVATLLLITLTTVNGCCCCDPLHLSKRRKQLDIMVAASCLSTPRRHLTGVASSVSTPKT